MKIRLLSSFLNFRSDSCKNLSSASAQGTHPRSTNALSIHTDPITRGLLLLEACNIAWLHHNAYTSHLLKNHL